jgi:hypothetical protein
LRLFLCALPTQKSCLLIIGFVYYEFLLSLIHNLKTNLTKPALLLLWSLLITVVSTAQTKITGTVSDHLGQLPLANITIKNSKTGTYTNENGSFSIDAKSTDTSQFSYLGYKTKDVLVGD